LYTHDNGLSLGQGQYVQTLLLLLHQLFTFVQPFLHWLSAVVCFQSAPALLALHFFQPLLHQLFEPLLHWLVFIFHSAAAALAIIRFRSTAASFSSI
jgi:hypothetical protein